MVGKVGARGYLGLSGGRGAGCMEWMRLALLCRWELGGEVIRRRQAE